MQKNITELFSLDVRKYMSLNSNSRSPATWSMIKPDPLNSEEWDFGRSLKPYPKTPQTPRSPN